MKNMRDHYEKKFHAMLEEKVPSELVRKQLEQLYEEEQRAIDQKEYELENEYRCTVSALTRLSKQTGMKEEELLPILERVLFWNKDLSLYRLIGVYNLFYDVKENIEQEAKKQSGK